MVTKRQTPNHRHHSLTIVSNNRFRNRSKIRSKNKSIHAGYMSSPPPGML